MKRFKMPLSIPGSVLLLCATAGLVSAESEAAFEGGPRHHDLISQSGMTAAILIVAAVLLLLAVRLYVQRRKANKKRETEEETQALNKRAKIRLFVSVVLILVLALLSVCSRNTLIHFCNDVFGSIDKPIIYLYPEAEQDVTVALGNDDKLLVSYPRYDGPWTVTAEPDGSLTDRETGRKLYALYYESENTVSFKVEKNGFVVKGSDAAAFLEEKLALLGLNYKETEEFIVYWLPKLEANPYNYIRFATADEIERNMSLTIEPQPDQVIRVLMVFKGLQKPIHVQEQILSAPKRSGFVAVEWGGVEL